MKTDSLVVKETPEGELYFTIPDDVLDRLGWKEGDDLIWDHDPKKQTCILRRVRYESVELDLDEDTFNRIAHAAHDNDVTFNQQVEMILRDNIEKVADSADI